MVAGLAAHLLAFRRWLPGLFFLPALSLRSLSSARNTPKSFSGRRAGDENALGRPEGVLDAGEGVCWRSGRARAFRVWRLGRAGDWTATTCHSARIAAQPASVRRPAANELRLCAGRPPPAHSSVGSSPRRLDDPLSPRPRLAATVAATGSNGDARLHTCDLALTSSVGQASPTRLASAPLGHFSTTVTKPQKFISTDEARDDEA